MPFKSDKKSKSATKKNKLRRNHRDDDSSEEDVENIHIEADSDEYETLSEEDSDTDSSYKPPKKNRRHYKKQESSDEEEESDDEDSDDEEIDSDEYDEDGSVIDPRELRKTLATLFPSNYINKKVKKDEKHKKQSSSKKAKSSSKDRPSSKRGRKHRKVESSSESEDDSEEYDDEYDDEEDDEEFENEDGKDFNIILTMGGGGQMLGQDDADEEALQDDNEECDSEDEKTFMKENYQAITMPKSIADIDNAKKLKKEKANKKKNRRHNKSAHSEDMEPADAETEYNDLIELKKHLSDKVAKNPKSKILVKKLEECRTSIRKLVKKVRMKNAKKYNKMVNSDVKRQSEIEYFKKEMSNQEQIRVMKELKKINEHVDVKKPYRLSLLDSTIPPKYKATVLQKVNMLRTMEPGDPEYYKLKTWVDAFMRIPFGVTKNLNVSMADGIDVCSDFMENAMKTLDQCVYGLNDAKMQIMQMIGQWIANPNALGSAIAIHGPPGTGKTSLVKEGISKILGREFSFIALGGTGDASFLEGHGYTYEGSLWGKIVQILMDSKCMNPVIYFDELDKVSDTPRGEEIIGILTHLTDTSQNTQFHDKYFSEVELDLSRCLFIFSYNDESKVNPILKDRMYRIQTKGYDAKEKLIIARNFLLPKIRDQVKFDEDAVIIPDETMKDLIANKSIMRGEEGVRNLKRSLEIIHTKLNLFRLMKPEKNIFEKDMDLKIQFPIEVTSDHVKKLIKNDDEPLNQSVLAMYI
jgi:ATP-dependent Lon protease